MPGKPKPDEVKILSETLRKDRVNPSKPKLGLDYPMPPDFLSERAAAAYQEIASMCYNMKVLTAADKTALVLLCESYADYRECREFIRENGRTYETYSTYQVKDLEGIPRNLPVEGSVMHRPYPQVAMMNEAWKQVRSMLAEFGLTPSSRSKVSAIGENEEDPFATFLSKK